MPTPSSAPSKVSSSNNKLVDTELRSLATERQANIIARVILSFSPSENEAYEKASRKRDLITSLKFSSN